jgi:hypothetical protein
MRAVRCAMPCKEQFMTRAVRRLFVLAFFVVAALALGASATYAQGGATSSLAGTVKDSTGAVIPGASVSVKNMGTAATSEAVTNAEGQFTVPALNAGTYSVTVSLSGFKTVTVNNVVLNAGIPAGISVKLEVGGVEEQVVVTGGSEVIATQSSTVSTTLSVKQIQSLPLTSRSALDFVANLPGVNTPGTVRDSTVNGLPQGSINMTLDGMSIQDNYLKTTDGFFARVQPRLDAIEEVTVTTAANGAEGGGQGAVNIRFVTKAGTNAFKGNVFYTLRHDALNANTFFNNRNLTDPVTGKAPKDALRQYQPGFNVGGPVVIPGLWDGHDKAFFFVNYEDTRNPSNITRNRVILNPAGMNGIYQYSGTGGTQSVNLLALAAANGQTSTIDPVIGKLFADMRSTSASGTTQNLADPLLQQATFQVPSNNFTPYPTARVDYNVSKNHRLTGSFNYNHVNSTPDTTNNREPFFAGLPEHRQPAVDAVDHVGVLPLDLRRQHRQHLPLRRHRRRDAVLARSRARPLRRQQPRRPGGYFLNIGTPAARPRSPTPAQRGVLGARGLDPADRGRPELAQGQAQPDLRRLDDAGHAVAAEPDDGAGASLRHPHRRSGGRHVHPAGVPGRVDRADQYRQGALLAPHRPGDPDPGQRPPQRGHGPV